MIGGTVDFRVIGDNWDETLRSRRRSELEPLRLRPHAPSRRLSHARTPSPRRFGKSDGWNARCSRSTGSATPPCAAGQRRPQQGRGAQRARSGPCSFIALAKSATGLSKIKATALRASISSSPPSFFRIPSIWDTPLTNCAPVAKPFPMICSPISHRSDGSTSPSTAIMFGRPSRYKTPSGPYEAPGPTSSMRLRVRFLEDSTMTPEGRREDSCPR